MEPGSKGQSDCRTSPGPQHTCGALDSTRFRNTEATRGRLLLKHDMWDKNPAVTETESGEGAEGQRWLRGGWVGVRAERQTGRGLHRQLEGIRVLDRDVSHAAAAAPD